MTPVVAAGFMGIEHFTPPWDVFFLPLFNLLVFLYEIPFFDFALAIIVFTIVIRTILAPLFIKQIRSQKEMQRMQPLIREVQRKHKGNRQKISEETMALYKEHGVNPAAGCLPVILQLPILFALYQALIRASGIIQGFVPNEGNQVAFDRLQDLEPARRFGWRAPAAERGRAAVASLPERPSGIEHHAAGNAHGAAPAAAAPTARSTATPSRAAPSRRRCARAAGRPSPPP